MQKLDNPTHDREVGVADATLDTTRIDDVRIGAVRPLISPALLLDELPVPAATQTLVEDTRKAIGDILHGRDDRLLLVVAQLQHRPIRGSACTRGVWRPT